MDTVLPSAVPDSAAPVAGDSGLSEQQLIQYIHSLRENQVVDGLFEDLKKEKHMSLTKLAHILKITDGLSNINIVESSVEPKTRALLEGIQQKVYDGIGLCPSIGGSFSELLGSLSLSATITKDLGSMEEFSREGKDNFSAECSFSVWIEKLKKDLELKASSASKELPEGCEWNWEFEEEFQRYLHVYMDILQEVNAMDDCMERDYLDKETLFQKLKFEFRYKHAINSYQHPYMVTISSLRQRQFYTRTRFRCNMQICKFLSKLVKLKPYIKVSDCSYDVIENLKQNHEILTEISDCEVQLVPVVGDFPSHLQLYAYAFVDNKFRDSMYYTAVEQIRLHKEFDNYLSSGELDHSMDEFISSKDEFVEDLIRDESTMAQFSDLNHALLKLSLERRADVLENQQQICIYSECLQRLLEDESDKKCFSDVVDEFSERVFSGHSLPKHYMIRGIIDCWLIFTRKGNSWQDTFEEVVVEACERWTENREKNLAVSS
uniref:Uncharacterized protein n=1 Tax=Oryza barthii TaxID=65489 RepID=A0A0D3HMB2_9ORYZ